MGSPHAPRIAYLQADKNAINSKAQAQVYMSSKIHEHTCILPRITYCGVLILRLWLNMTPCRDAGGGDWGSKL